jgi:hypothetical protein
MMSKVGGHVVVLDGGDRPCAIWRTRSVDVKPLDQVDAAFAWDEGEGERTREDWLAMHSRYFAARAAAEAFAFDDSMPAVFERFLLGLATRACGSGGAGRNRAFCQPEQAPLRRGGANGVRFGLSRGFCFDAFI